MNPALVIIAAVVIVAAFTFGNVLVRRSMKPAAIVWHENADPTDRQWTVDTPVGLAVVTAVRSTRGTEFEIETDFRGEGVRLHYVAPARKIAERRLSELVDEYRAR